MADTHDILIKVDAAQAKRELSSFSAALTKTQQTVQSIAGASAGGGFSGLASQIKQLSNGFQQLKSVTGLNALAKDINTLNAALGAFRAPSAASVQNIVGLGKALSGMGRVAMPRGIGAELQSIGQGLSSIRVPNMNNLRQIPAFVQEVQKLGQIKIDPRGTADLTALGKAMSGFRVPNPQAAQNAARFISALATGGRIGQDAITGITSLSNAFAGLKVPTAGNVNNLARLINTLSTGNVGAVKAMAQALSSMKLPTSFPRINMNTGGGGAGGAARGNAGGGGGGNRFAALTSGAQGATGALKGLENQFSATYHVSSLLRVAMGSLTLGAFTSSVMETGRTYQLLSRSLEAVSASAGETESQLAFLHDLTARLPIDAQTAAQAFQKFGVASREAGFSVADTQKIFEGFQTAFAGMGLDTTKQKYAMLAVQEMMTKGSINLKELQRQLGNDLPGVLSVVAQSMGISMGALHKQLASGGLPISELTNFADLLKSKWAPAVTSALAQGGGAATMFGNRWTDLKDKVFNGGFDTGMATMFNQLTTAMNSPQIESAAKQIGAAFGEVFRIVGAVGTVALQNIVPITMFGGALAALAAGGALIGGLRMIGNQFLWIGMSAVQATLGIIGMGMSLAGAAIGESLAMASRGAAAVAISMRGMGVAAMLAGTAIKVGIVGALFYAAAEFGKFIGESVNNLFPNFAAGVQGWKDSLSENNPFKGLLGGHSAQDIAAAEEGGTELGKATSKGIMESLMDDLKNFDPVAGLKNALAALKIGGGDAGVIKQFEDALAASEKLKASIEGTAKAQGDYATNAQNAANAARAAMTEMTTGEDKLMKKLQPWRVAMEEIATDMRTIAGMSHLKLGDNAMDDAKLDKIREIMKYNMLPKIDPLAGTMRSMLEEMNETAGLKGNALADENEYLKIKNDLLSKGINLEDKNDAQMVKAKETVRGMIESMRELKAGGNNGFSQWAFGVQDFKTAMDGGVKTSLDGLSNTLADLVSKGKADFASLAQSILHTFAQIAIKSLMEKPVAAIGDMFKDNSTANMAAGKALVDAGNAKMDKLAGTTTAQMNVEAATVIINGTGVSPLGAGGTGATGMVAGKDLPATGVQTFGTPVTTSITGVNPAPLGGNGAMTMVPSIAPQGTVGTLDSGVMQGASNWDLKGGVGVTQGQYVPSIDQAIPTIGSGFANGQGFEMNPLTLAPAIAAAVPAIAASKAFGVTGIVPQGAGAMSAGIGGTKSIALSDADIKNIAKVSYTETAQPLMKLNPEQFDLQRKGVVDTMLNRVSTGKKEFGADGGVEGMLNHRRAFSKITGPENLHPYGSVAKTPDAPKWYEDKVRDDITSRADGSRADVTNGGLYYANPNHITENNREWVQQVQKNGVTYGQGDMVQAYGNPNGVKAATGFGIKTPGQQQIEQADLPAVGAHETSFSMGGPGFQMPGQQAMNQEMEASAAKFQTAMTPATQSVGQSLQQNLTQATSQIGQQGSAGLSGLTSKVGELGGAAQSAEGGVGGLLQKLLGMGGAGGGGGAGGFSFDGPGGGMGGVFGGLFKEGGYSDSPVSMGGMSASAWHGAPHYAEGTPNTSGGMPAILHDNEAVIPLSRGRSIPVEMSGDPVKNVDNPQPVVNNFHFHGVKDHDSFRRSQDQIAAGLAATQQRASQSQG